MGTSLERRLGALETAQDARSKPVVEMTNRELLAIVLRGTTGEPTDAELDRWEAMKDDELRDGFRRLGVLHGDA